MTFLVSWGCASDFLAILPKKKLQKLFGQFFLTFQNHVLAKWGCASDFLKTLPKFKMAARGQLQFFLWAQNSKILSRKLFKFYYHIPHDMEMCR